MTSALAFNARMDPLLLALSPVFNGILRFISGATPADLLTIHVLVYKHWYGPSLGSIAPPSHSVRQNRRSTGSLISSRDVISTALHSVRYDLQFRRLTCGGSTNFLKLNINPFTTEGPAAGPYVNTVSSLRHMANYNNTKLANFNRSDTR